MVSDEKIENSENDENESNESDFSQKIDQIDEFPDSDLGIKTPKYKNEIKFLIQNYLYLQCELSILQNLSYFELNENV